MLVLPANIPSVGGAAVTIEHVHSDEKVGTTEPVVFSSVALGSAEAKEIVFVISIGGGGDVVGISDIGGNSVTEWMSYINSAEAIYVYHVSLNTETSETVTIDLNFVTDEISLDVFKVVGGNTTLQDSQNSADSDPATLTIDVAANGGVIAGFIQRSNAAVAVTWTGVSKAAGKGSSARVMVSLWYGASASEVYASADATKTITGESDQNPGVRNESIVAVSIKPA